ncbi:MAG: hypothetical protein HY238_08800, partial [Acidobacteria bacterium]|nr:hypothetical protein [Acidobacteriota bacterium]
ERRHERISIKFNEAAAVDRHKLMAYLGSTPGAEFTPAGVLKFTVDGAGPAQTIAAVKDLLYQLSVE